MKFILVLMASLILSVLVFAQTSTVATKMPRSCEEKDKEDTGKPGMVIEIDPSTGNLTASGDQLFIFKTTIQTFKDKFKDQNGKDYYRVFFDNDARWFYIKDWLGQWIPLCGKPEFIPGVKFNGKDLSEYFRNKDRSKESGTKTKTKGSQIAVYTYDGQYGLYTYQGTEDGTASNLWEKAKIASPPVIVPPASVIVPPSSVPNPPIPVTGGGSVWGGP
jgi:hypothetical protein